ncbi:hypothetical protein UFOVP1169_56 [uncultured Caudovirales phage]|uniref:Uncharacterized protein n=1 Tax=uncultured Caudovirales phage TaxID=2100421 RepID=A0A6J5R0B8_9CAUD|nr:hypothetical protein UFOVP1169_56 [uncultured Caudovirales phage]
MKFAHIETGAALDPQFDTDAGKYAARFAPGIMAQWVISQVPDDTQHGAKDNGDGTFTNPGPPPAKAVPLTLSATGFQDACETGLGSTARFGKIIRDMAESADDQVFSTYQRFIKSTTFDKSKAAPLFSLLVSKGLMTAPERTAILAAWPEA